MDADELNICSTALAGSDDDGAAIMVIPGAGLPSSLTWPVIEPLFWSCANAEGGAALLRASRTTRKIARCVRFCTNPPMVVAAVSSTNGVSRVIPEYQ